MILTISNGTPHSTQIHDLKTPRWSQTLHGRPSRPSLSLPGCGNRTALRVPRRLQVEVPLPLCRFREIERNNLDRHSYEIQIKELTEEINIYESLRTENGKLKDFIKKQSVWCWLPQTEIENLNRFSRDNRGLDDSFKTLYEKSNERLTQLELENQKLLELNEEYRMQVQSFNARLEAF